MSDETRTIGVRFTLDEDERSTVLMDLTARADDVLVLVSVQIGPDGRLRSWTKWEEGLPRLIRWDASARRVEEVPLPAAPTVTQVLEDAIGPLDDPEARGYRKVASATYEIAEGLGIFRLHAPGSLDTRVFEAVDPGSGKVRSRISGIRLGDRPGVTGDLLEKMAAVPLDGGGAGARFLRPEEPS